MEGDDERGQTAVLRGTVEVVQVAHGKASGLPVPAQAQTDVHCGRQKNEDIRVQDADAAAAQRDAAVMVPRRGRGTLGHRTGRRRNQFRVSAGRVHIAGHDVLAGQLAVVRRRQPRRRLEPENVVVSNSQTFAAAAAPFPAPFWPDDR